MNYSAAAECDDYYRTAGTAPRVIPSVVEESLDIKKQRANIRDDHPVRRMTIQEEAV